MGQPDFSHQIYAPYRSPQTKVLFQFSLASELKTLPYFLALSWQEILLLLPSKFYHIHIGLAFNFYYDPEVKGLQIWYKTTVNACSVQQTLKELN